jgi:Leucine-rich repeat (LRR) protein
MKLEMLDCNGAPLSDLSPLKGMPLSYLCVVGTAVSDISILQGMMSLKFLYIENTKVTDLRPIQGMRLEHFDCEGARVSDLSVLKDMPLKLLSCDFKPERDTEILRSIKTLKTINRKPAAEFWKEVEEQEGKKPLGFETPDFDQWVKDVAGMPAEKQVEAVSKKLMELNPGFDGKNTIKNDNGVVTVFQFSSDSVIDISPVRALVGLASLHCNGSDRDKSKFSDLSPLKGMPLTWLAVGLTRVSDLSPLKGMPLTHLDIHLTLVTDLVPLKDIPLEALHCWATPISDLSPLKGMSLTKLYCGATPISDLSPLEGIPLTLLDCAETQISDLSPLKGMPLSYLGIGRTQVSDLSPIKDLPLTELYFHGIQVSDLSSVKGMKLIHLDCSGTKVSDLSPLKGMPLKTLNLNFKPERDTELLRSIKTLETINGKPAAEFWKEVEEQQNGKKP